MYVVLSRTMGVVRPVSVLPDGSKRVQGANKKKVVFIKVLLCSQSILICSF